MEETNRQKKVASILQSDIVEVIQTALREAGVRNILVSVTKVRVTSDLSIAKVYLSIFPNADGSRILPEIQAVKSQIKHQIAQRTKHQMRRMPELHYFIDDSLEYIDELGKALRGNENPIHQRDLLDRRKKK